MGGQEDGADEGLLEPCWAGAHPHARGQGTLMQLCLSGTTHLPRAGPTGGSWHLCIRSSAIRLMKPSEAHPPLVLPPRARGATREEVTAGHLFSMTSEQGKVFGKKHIFCYV